MREPLDIAILGTRGIPNVYGGFEQFAEFVSTALADRGHRVTVYCSDAHPYKKAHWKNVALVHCEDPENEHGTIGQFVYDWNCIEHARKRSFQVILQLGYTSSSIWFWRWPRQSAHIVNMDGLEYKRSKYSRPVQLFLRLAEKLATLRADLLIADNEGILKHLLLRYPKKPMQCIAYGAEIPALRENWKDHLKKYRLEVNDYDLLICRLEPENNVETIIKSHLQSNCGRKLVVVGNTSTKLGKQLLLKYRSEFIEFTKGIYDTEVLTSLKTHCCLYFHGHSVGGTNPSLLEAMACAKHIVAHDNQFNRSVLDSSGSYFKDETELAAILDAEEMAKNINHLEATRKKLGEEYTWAKITDAYENACYEVVKG